MHRKQQILLLLTIITLVGLRIPAGAKTISIDCAKGQSINKALTDGAPELIIEIRGICSEDVLIRRDKVTLHGSDPNLDGIQGVGPNEPGRAVVRIRDASAVRLENLMVTGGARSGIVATDILGRVTIVNCKIMNNSGDGIQSNAGSFVEITNTTFTDNGRAQAATFAGGGLSCTGCTISGGIFGVISTSIGLDLNQSNVDSEIAVFGQFGGSSEIVDTTLSGSIQAYYNATINLDNSQQTANPDENFLEANSSLLVRGSSSIVGPVHVVNFSNLALHDGSVSGDLTCESGGNAFCEDPGDVSGSVSGCALCVQSTVSQQPVSKKGLSPGDSGAALKSFRLPIEP